MKTITAGIANTFIVICTLAVLVFGVYGIGILLLDVHSGGWQQWVTFDGIALLFMCCGISCWLGNHP